MLDSIEESVLEASSQDELLTYLNSLFDQAIITLQESNTWPVLGAHHPTITTRYKRFPSKHACSSSPRMTSDHTYVQRQSRHHDISFSQIRNVLLDPCHGAKYLSGLLDTKPLKSLLFKNETTSAGIYGSRVQATLTLPREYVDLVATRQEHDDAFWVITQPIDTDHGPKKNHVRAQHLAWNHVCKKKDENGTVWVEWTRIEQSCAGGWIPCFLSNWNCGNELARDVDDLVEYIKHQQTSI